jgi:ABC-type antimicrobial peptide transport system permease subunit
MIFFQQSPDLFTLLNKLGFVEMSGADSLHLYLPPRAFTVDFKIIKFTGLGVIVIIALAILTPLLAVIFPLINLSKKKTIDIIKVS